MLIFMLHCTHSVSLQWNGSYCCRQRLWRWLEKLQVKDEGSTLWYKQIYSVGFSVSPTYSHLGTVSSNHGLKCIGICWAHTALESGFSQLGIWSHGGVDYIVSPFQSTITGVVHVVWGFRSYHPCFCGNRWVLFSTYYIQEVVDSAPYTTGSCKMMFPISYLAYSVNYFYI